MEVVFSVLHRRLLEALPLRSLRLGVERVHLGAVAAEASEGLALVRLQVCQLLVSHLQVGGEGEAGEDAEVLFDHSSSSILQTATDTSRSCQACVPGWIAVKIWLGFPFLLQKPPTTKISKNLSYV